MCNIHEERKKYCNNRQIPEKILIAKTKEVLGLPSLEDIDLKDWSYVKI